MPAHRGGGGAAPARARGSDQRKDKARADQRSAPSQKGGPAGAAAKAPAEPRRDFGTLPRGLAAARAGLRRLASRHRGQQKEGPCDMKQTVYGSCAGIGVGSALFLLLTQRIQLRTLLQWGTIPFLIYSYWPIVQIDEDGIWPTLWRYLIRLFSRGRTDDLEMLLSDDNRVAPSTAKKPVGVQQTRKSVGSSAATSAVPTKNALVAHGPATARCTPTALATQKLASDVVKVEDAPVAGAVRDRGTLPGEQSSLSGVALSNRTVSAGALEGPPLTARHSEPDQAVEAALDALEACGVDQSEARAGLGRRFRHVAAKAVAALAEAEADGLSKQAPQTPPEEEPATAAAEATAREAAPSPPPAATLRRSWSDGDVAALALALDAEQAAAAQDGLGREGQPEAQRGGSFAAREEAEEEEESAVPIADVSPNPAGGIWLSEAADLAAAWEAARAAQAQAEALQAAMFPALDRSVYLGEQYFD